MTPSLPLEEGRAGDGGRRIHVSDQAVVRTPPAARTAAAESSGPASLPSRKWRLGQMARLPAAAKVRVTSLLQRSHPGMWWMTTTPPKCHRRWLGE